MKPPVGGQFQIFPESADLHLLLTLGMRDLIVLLVHLTTVILRIASPGGYAPSSPSPF